MTAQQQPAPAQDAARTARTFGVSLGVGETDNVARTAQSVRADMEVLGLNFNFVRQSPRLDGTLFGDVTVRRYSTDALTDNDEVIGSVDGRLGFDNVGRELG